MITIHHKIRDTFNKNYNQHHYYITSYPGVCCLYPSLNQTQWPESASEQYRLSDLRMSAQSPSLFQPIAIQYTLQYAFSKHV
jgi:hypothetical protein